MEYTKAQEKALNALRKAETGAFGRVRAYVVIAPKAAHNAESGLFEGGYGKIKVAYPADGAGKLHVFMWDCVGSGLQYGWASGYGYDKLSAALAGLKFDDITFTDHSENWEMQLREAGYAVIQAV